MLTLWNPLQIQQLIKGVEDGHTPPPTLAQDIVDSIRACAAEFEFVAIELSGGFVP